MKTKFTILIASLLLAVGWTSIASAQALPKDSFADQLAPKDFKPYTGPIMTVMATPSTDEQGTMAKAPKRAAYKLPSVVKPKAYYDTLTYSWSNPTNGKSGTDVPATELATDPYQIYQLLKFVYMDPRFPGPYYNACSSTNEAEDPVYYGGIEGGWNIPFTSTSGEGGSTGPVTYTHEPITITTQSWNAYITAIRVVDATTEEVLTSWTQNTSGTTQTLPTGWSSTANLTYYSSDGGCYMGSSASTGGSITISSSLLNQVGANHETLRVYVTSFATANNTYTLYIANTSVSATATLTTTTQNWYYDFTGTSSSGSTVTSGETIPQDVLITASNGGIDIASITVTDASSGSTITSWSAGATLPSGWYSNKSLATSGGYAYMNGGGTIRIAADLFEGHNSITVTTQARFSSTQVTSGTLQISNNERAWTLSSSTVSNCAATINFPAKVATDTYKPNEEGYTALVVQVKNNNTIYTEPEDYLGAWEFAAGDSTALINYIGANIKSVQLLTDGLRIGEGENTGTVFNCSGTYNKFFFLGKGRARKKSSGVLASIGLSEYAWPSYASEEGPFKFMFEQFSPTGGEEGSQITDFYIEMMDGNVYDVVHDCASVIQNGHQFSMTGNTGSQEYAMSGMNFFIPDYRLKYWRNDSIGITTKSYQPNDGRDMNPYMVGDDNGKTGAAFGQATYFAVNFAQYNPQHAPKVGIYILTLDADAKPCEGYDIETNHNYVVTLDWTSSLNEMSGHDVPQTYVIYEVINNEDGSTTLDSITTVHNQTHYDFDGKLWPQGEHSESHNYIIMGYPTDNHHPSFIAWSNEDAIVIPGLNDFLELGLTHYESDFDVPKMQNWYRNFLTVNNDGYVGLTTRGIFEGDSVFNLMRFENTDSTITKQVARLKFENMNDGRVKYTINYVDANGQNTQDVEADKYELTAMNIPVSGYLTTKSAGDILIQPNGYDVNFLSIKVQAGSYNQTWTSSQSTLPNGWSVSDGSMWVLEDGARYLEGGGYILIPAAILGNYTTATVTINAYGDAGKTAKITVNNDTKSILNGSENARDYVWTVTNGNSAGHNAPRRATTTDVTFAAGTNTGSNTSANAADNMSSNDVTINSTLAAFGRTDNYRLAANSTTTISTTSGTITKIVFNGTTTAYVTPLSLVTGQPGSMTTSGTARTWTGEASSVKFTTSSQVRCTSIVVTVSTDDSGQGGETTEEAITWWDYNETPSQQPQEVNTDWVLDAGGQDAAIDEGYGFWFNNTGSLTIPASYFENYTDIRVEISYAMDPNYTGTTGGYITVNGSQSTATTSTTFRTYSWTNVDASNGIVIVPSTGYLYFKYIKVYGTRVGGGDGPVQPTVDGVIRMANLRIVDQFAQEIPNTNDHPYRYTYFLKLANSDKQSSMVPVPVQHTGAKVQGYYTEKEMIADTIPANFLTEEVLSAQVDMNLSPSSAPYFYTINSKKNGVPAKADDYATYLNVLQRRSAGDYQEMQTKSSGVVNPMLSHIYEPGDNNFFDFRKVCAQQKSDSLSYVPIVWTNGINRHYYVTDSLHNSYGAPIWETRVGDVTIVSSNIERQATVKADGTVVWNSSVNWYDADSTQAYSLYMVSDLQAQGVLPVSNIEYEPYMFRLWLVDSTQSLRGYRWEFKQNGDPLRIVDAPELTPANGWLLLDTKMCENAADLTYSVTKNTQNWANNLMFGAKISDSFKPKLVVRFYYKVKGAPANGNMLRGINDKDNVGYVVLKGTNPHDPSTGVIEVAITGEVVGQTYYNTLGQSSDRPFEGINIVVTHYSDGTTSTSKVRF